LFVLKHCCLNSTACRQLRCGTKVFPIVRLLRPHIHLLPCLYRNVPVCRCSAVCITYIPPPLKWWRLTCALQYTISTYCCCLSTRCSVVPHCRTAGYATSVAHISYKVLGLDLGPSQHTMSTCTAAAYELNT
jgi:hypothetical protein